MREMFAGVDDERHRSKVESWQTFERGEESQMGFSFFFFLYIIYEKEEKCFFFLYVIYETAREGFFFFFSLYVIYEERRRRLPSKFCFFFSFRWMTLKRERGVGKEEKSKCELKLKEGIFVISPPIYPKSQLFYNQS